MPGFDANSKAVFSKADLDSTRRFSGLCKTIQKVFESPIAELAKKAEVASIELGIAIKENREATNDKPKEK